MREMKDSGNVWYGKIPYAWELNKIKYLTTIRSESAIYNPEEDKYIGLENVNGYSDNVVETDTEYDYSMQSICKKDDILFSKLRPYLAKVFIAKHNSFCTGEFIVFSSFNGDRRYLFYSILNPKFIENINSSTYGAKMPRANPQYIFDQQICLPPLVEQQRIAEFLDRECGKIDGLKADIQAQIDTLEQYKRSVITEAVTHGLNPSAPMKDSGIPWVGQFPTHWTKKKGKYILRYMSKPVKQNDGVITCFRDGEVTLRSNRREDGFTMADKEIGYQGVDVGDLVVHGMDGFAGAIGISDSRGKASPVLNVLNTKQNKKYIMYYLRSMAYGEVFTALSTGIRVRSCDLRWNKLAELLYPLPPIDEQNNIVNYIDEQIARTNEIIADKKTQIETLDGYKKSLIYEYVTGKKEVG